MKGKNLILTALITLVAGVLMLIYRDSLASGSIIRWVGIMCIVAGVVNVTVFLCSRDKNGEARMGAFGTTFGWIVSGAAVVLGLAMAIFSSAFVVLFGFMLGFVLLFCALFQLVLLVYGSRPARLNGAFYIVPVLLIIGAIYVFSLKSGVDERSIMMTTGIGLSLFGLATIVELIAMESGRKAIARKQTADSAEPQKPAEESADKAENE